VAAPVLFAGQSARVKIKRPSYETIWWKVLNFDRMDRIYRIYRMEKKNSLGKANASKF
jgi:hypothetical protein